MAQELPNRLKKINLKIPILHALTLLTPTLSVLTLNDPTSTRIFYDRGSSIQISFKKLYGTHRCRIPVEVRYINIANRIKIKQNKCIWGPF